MKNQLVPRAKSSLLCWYNSSARDLPWRRDITPYRTWVSEIMLQQTTVAAVIPYFNRFLRRFPDIADLAAASEEEVLLHWAGLGYYSRARNLRLAAQAIMAQHGGRLPGDYDKILALPGIGRYTAGAILSIAFQKPAAALDGNVMRVFSRIYGLKGDIKQAKTMRGLWDLAEKQLTAKNPGAWNQALMELGATVCLPESPDCGACPVSRYCAAFKKGLQDSLPVTGPRREFIDLKWTCLWIEKNDKILLWKRYNQERFLKNHWGLPESRHLRVENGPRLKTVRHTITHHKIVLEVRKASAPETAPPQAAWTPRPELGKFLVSSLWLKCL